MTLWGALTCLRAEKTPFEPDLDHTSVGKYAMVVGRQPSAVSRTCGGFKHFYYYKRVTENRSHKKKVASFLALQRLTKPLVDGHIPYTENGRRLFRVKE